MKSGFTRTGKRTLGGAVDDGVKAVSRYFLNNFSDGHKQDAVDLVTGAWGRLGLRRGPLLCRVRWTRAEISSRVRGAGWG